MTGHKPVDSRDHGLNDDLTPFIADIQKIIKNVTDIQSTCDNMDLLISSLSEEVNEALNQITNNRFEGVSNKDILSLKDNLFKMRETFSHLIPGHISLSDARTFPVIPQGERRSQLIPIPGSNDSSLRTNYLKKIPVLLIHHDIIILDQMMHNLFQSGYFQVFPFMTIESALQSLSDVSYGMVLISAVLIQKDSSLIMNRIRERNQEILVFSVFASRNDNLRMIGMDNRINGELSEDSTLGDIIETFLMGLQRLSTCPI